MIPTPEMVSKIQCVSACGSSWMECPVAMIIFLMGPNPPKRGWRGEGWKQGHGLRQRDHLSRAYPCLRVIRGKSVGKSCHCLALDPPLALLIIRTKSRLLPVAAQPCVLLRALPGSPASSWALTLFSQFILLQSHLPFLWSQTPKPFLS